ncbi:MAG: hypothetical protein ACRCZA_05875, partial [Shewanella sp.]|uniref:hypothetical protein n=1 Tax=Shewanella sp. TaxID=50422 RepID=UPI003F2B89DA
VVAVLQLVIHYQIVLFFCVDHELSSDSLQLWVCCHWSADIGEPNGASRPRGAQTGVLRLAC